MPQFPFGISSDGEMQPLYAWLGVIQNEDGSLKASGAAASMDDGGTITHGLGATPRVVQLTTSTAGEIASATTVGETTITVAIKKHDGTAGTTQTIYWLALA